MEEAEEEASEEAGVLEGGWAHGLEGGHSAICRHGRGQDGSSEEAPAGGSSTRTCWQHMEDQPLVHGLVMVAIHPRIRPHTATGIIRLTAIHGDAAWVTDGEECTTSLGSRDG